MNWGYCGDRVTLDHVNSLQCYWSSLKLWGYGVSGKLGEVTFCETLSFSELELYFFYSWFNWRSSAWFCSNPFLESGTTLENCHDFIASQRLSDTKITGKSRSALGQLKLLIQRGAASTPPYASLRWEAVMSKYRLSVTHWCNLGLSEEVKVIFVKSRRFESLWII